MLEILKTEEFSAWLNCLTNRQQAQIENRLRRIELHEHLGDAKYLGDYLVELRWKNGWRVYFYRQGNLIALLIGGEKNGQEKDIQKARALFKRYSLGSSRQ